MGQNVGVGVSEEDIPEDQLVSGLIGLAGILLGPVTGFFVGAALVALLVTFFGVEDH